MQEADHGRGNPRKTTVGGKGQPQDISAEVRRFYDAQAAAMPPARPRDGDAQWYLVHTTRAVPLVRASIASLIGAEDIYQPMVLVRRKIMRRNLNPAQRKAGHDFFREVQTPLLPRYLLVRFDFESGIWSDIMRAVGFEGIACEGNWPYPARSEIVERLHVMERNGSIPGSTPISAFTAGEEVRIEAGPFRGFNGTIESIDESARVSLFVALFGRVTPVELNADQLAKL